MKTIDFPAGHSMDTDWFAVDKDGNIGFFDSGSGGVVPIQIVSEDLSFDLFYKYAKPVSKGLRELLLDETTIQNLLSKCTAEAVEEICIDSFVFCEGCLLLLNEGKTWEDLEMADYYAQSTQEFALLLSRDIPLYMLSGIYNNCDILVNAVKKNVVAKARAFELYDNIVDTALCELGGFVYTYDDDWSNEPYMRLNIPEQPLHITQFNIPETEPIPNFSDISFKDKKYIHPMEYMSSKSYDIYDHATQEWSDKGYAVVNITDKEWAYCLRSVNEQIQDKIHTRDRCEKCYPKMWQKSLSFAKFEALQDYPPVVVIRDYYLYDFHNVQHAKYDELLQCLSDTLNIRTYDYYLTYCAKCYNWNDKKEEFTPDRVESRFSNCHQHLETELSVLQPLLLIAIEKTVVNMLKMHYQTDGFSAAPCLCRVSIDGKTYPLLALPQAKTKAEIADLSSRLSTLSEEVKTILSQPRAALETRPRSVKPEKNFI